MRQSQSKLTHSPPPAQLLVFIPHPGGLPFPGLPPLRRRFGQERGLIPEAAVRQKRQSTDCFPHRPHQPSPNKGRTGPKPTRTQPGAQVGTEGSPQGGPHLLSILMPCSSTSRSQARCLCWASQRKRDSLCRHTSSSCWGPSAIASPGTQRGRTRLAGSQDTPQRGKERCRQRSAPGHGGNAKTHLYVPEDPPEHSPAAQTELLLPLLLRPPPRPLTTPSQHCPSPPVPPRGYSRPPPITARISQSLVSYWSSCPSVIPGY